MHDSQGPITQVEIVGHSTKDKQMIEDSASKLDPRQVQALPAPPPPVAQIAGLTPSFPGQVVNGIIQGSPYSITTIPGTISQNGLPNIPQFPNGIPQPQAPSFNTPGQPFGTASSTISNVGAQIPQVIPYGSTLQAAQNNAADANAPAPFAPVEQLPGTLPVSSYGNTGVIYGPSIENTPASGVYSPVNGVAQNVQNGVIGNTVNGIPVVGGTVSGVVQGLPNPQGLLNGALPLANGIVGPVQGAISAGQGLINSPMPILQGSTPLGEDSGNGIATEDTSSSPPYNALQGSDGTSGNEDGQEKEAGISSPSSTMATPPTSPDATEGVDSSGVTSTTESPELTTTTESLVPTSTNDPQESSSIVTETTAEASSTVDPMEGFHAAAAPEHAAPSSLPFSPPLSVPTNTPVNSETAVVASIQGTLPISAPLAIPSVPSVPSVPVAPSAPSAPSAASGAPNAPNVPNVPNAPNVPTVPSVPSAPGASGAPSVPNPLVFIRAPRNGKMVRNAQVDESLPSNFPAPSAPIEGDLPPLLRTDMKGVRANVQPSSVSAMNSGPYMTCTSSKAISTNASSTLSSDVAPTSTVSKFRRRFFRFNRKENA